MGAGDRVDQGAYRWGERQIGEEAPLERRPQLSMSVAKRQDQDKRLEIEMRAICFLTVAL